MSGEEIRVPKEVREFIPDWAEETILGEPQGSRKQYRYGNLHIREYEDEYTVHTDMVDPRKDKLGHLIYDAPEVLVGIGCGLAAGYVASRLSTRHNNKKPNNSNKGIAIPVALASGYAAYMIAKKIRSRALTRHRLNSNHTHKTKKREAK